MHSRGELQVIRLNRTQNMACTSHLVRSAGKRAFYGWLTPVATILSYVQLLLGPVVLCNPYDADQPSHMLESACSAV